MHMQMVVSVCTLAMLRASAALSITYHQDSRLSGLSFISLPDGKTLTRLNITSDKTQALGVMTARYILDGAAPGNFIFSTLCRTYLSISNLPSGSQLLAIPPSAAGRDWTLCDVPTISRIVKHIAGTAALPENQFASHSLRRSGATFYHQVAKRSEDEIRQLGFWLSDSVALYTGTPESHALRILRSAAEAISPPSDQSH